MNRKPLSADRVLIVEDNLDLAENIAEMLSEEVCRVTLAHDAETAVRLAREQGFDLAIVDIRLGGAESGLDLIPRLRRESVHGEVLLMTGNASLQSAIRAIRSGVYAYVPKPFDSEQFTTLVRRALAQVALKREKHALTRRLSASEALYRGVVETVEAFILGIDANGIVRFANRFVSERFGLSLTQVLGQPFSVLGGHVPNAAPSTAPNAALDAAVRRAIRGEPVRDLDALHPTERTPRTVRWTFTPLAPSTRHEDESAEGALEPIMLAVGIDLTYRLDLERRHAEAEAMAAMGTLTTSLAHEIRNPLNAAKLQLELLARRAGRSTDPVLREQVLAPTEIVRAELQRLSALLDEFLGLAQPRMLRLDPVSVDELLRSVHDLKSPLAQSLGVTLHVRCPPELHMRADRDRIKQVLLNLVGNAIEALQTSQTVSAEVTLSAAREATGIRLSVTDNGPGLSEAVAASAFKPFVTDKPGGTGLGLAIVHKIALQHGGHAQLLPRPGGGLDARIFIPD